MSSYLTSRLEADRGVTIEYNCQVTAPEGGEHLEDRRHLRACEEFLNESAQAFLTLHETWLKRHEVKGLHPRRKPFARAGVGVFAIRGG
jgi:hypothetical protein